METADAEKRSERWANWRWVLWTVVAVAIVPVLYMEEDLRGAATWMGVKNYWESKGETFDYKKFTPPPEPDEQNLALDFDQLRHRVEAQYRAAFPGKELPPSAAAQYAELFPILGELREASAARPYFRFNLNYELDERDNSAMEALTQPIKLTRAFKWDEVVALDAGDSTRALDDLKLNNKVMRGLIEQPVAVSGLVAVAMVKMNLSAVYNGIALHKWTDAQLAELEEDLGKLDFIRDYHQLMRGEVIGVMVPTIDRMKATGTMLEPTDGDNALKRSPILTPIGWLDMVKARTVDADLTASGWSDPEARVFLPKAIADYKAEIGRRLDRWTIYLPWNWLLRVSINSTIFTFPHQFAEAQVWVDQARIACALERYRLAKGKYPAALGELSPVYIDAVPCDVMSGGAYRYRLNQDGTFLLYSVGWNGVDDGGVSVKVKESPTMRSYEEGDWVWPVVRK